MAKDPRIAAKHERELRLRELAEVVEACTCEWPIRVMRNGHGHNDRCPAADVVRKHQESR